MAPPLELSPKEFERNLDNGLRKLEAASSQVKDVHLGRREAYAMFMGWSVMQSKLREYSTALAMFTQADDQATDAG